MSRPRVARHIVGALWVVCVLLLVLGLQEAQTGNLRPLLMAFVTGALGLFIVWFRSRRMT